MESPSRNSYQNCYIPEQNNVNNSEDIPTDIKDCDILELNNSENVKNSGDIPTGRKYNNIKMEDDTILQVSGQGYWYLSGWIGDYPVDFLIDSGSSVTALSAKCYEKLRSEGASMGPLQPTAKKLRGAGGSSINVHGATSCIVHFLGLEVNLLIIVCDLHVDAIMGNDALGTELPHILDIKTGKLFADGGITLQLHRRDTALTGRIFTKGHTCVPANSEVLMHCSVRTTGGKELPSPVLIEGLQSFSEETGLMVGRSLVDPSKWTVPVLVTNFSTENVTVGPFHEVALITPVAAIQSVDSAENIIQSTGSVILPHHLQALVDATSPDLDEVQRSQLSSVLGRYVHLFPTPGTTLTGHTDAVQHEINTGRERPIRCAPRRMTATKIAAEEKCVKDMLAGGQIEHSDSPWSAPVVLVTKKDGGTRFCVDYRRLNNITVKDAYPLPRIDDTLDMLAGKQWFSTLDLASGYWQIALSDDARQKTAFATHSGLFQFRVMPFGLCNAPATFERLMDRVLQGLRWSRCLVYLDDIISFGQSFDSALDNLVLIFERLQAYGLQLKASKCHLFRTSVPFLGHVVGRDGLHCDPSKIEDVKSWPIPDCLKSTRQFLGFVGYYRRFIKQFADRAAPLVALTGKDVPFIWTSDCMDSFNSLRQALICAPVLAFPTEAGEYILDTDASNYGIGGVLSQLQNGEERVIAYCSRALRPSQRRYCTTKREMLGVVVMCTQFRSYLRGLKFTLRTDHKSLVWLHRFKDTEGMLSRWMHLLQQFNFVIVHRAGQDHGNADGLSRVNSSPCPQCTRPDCKLITTPEDTDDQPFDSSSTGSSMDTDLLPVETGENWCAQLDDDMSGGTPADLSVTELQARDPTCQLLVSWIKTNSFPAWSDIKGQCPEVRALWHHRDNLSVDQSGVVWRRRSGPVEGMQLLVPKSGRETLFHRYHSSAFGGHLGRNRTVLRLQQRFYWTGMALDVQHWLADCTVCMRRKSPNNRRYPLGNIPTGHRWDRIAMDIMDVCDPTPAGYRYILVIADYFTKWTEAFPIKDKCADTVADILVREIVCRFGMPLVIHSDQGREFENGLMHSMCDLLGCTKTKTAPYHPASDGMIERFNRTCVMMLSMFVNDRRDNWDELLPFVMHAYRTSVHESTGYSPFRLMMGEECSLPADVMTPELRALRLSDKVPHPFASWVRDALEVAYDHVRESLGRSAGRRKRLYDLKATERKFPLRSWVLRYYPPAAKHKLGSPWIGPCQVVRQATGHTVGIQKSLDSPIVFVHIDDLKPCSRPEGVNWSPTVTQKSALCASTVVPVSAISSLSTFSGPTDDIPVKDTGTRSLKQPLELDTPIDLSGHVLSPLFARHLDYNGARFHSMAHLMLYRDALMSREKARSNNIRGWRRPLADFPVSAVNPDRLTQQQNILGEIYDHLCTHEDNFKDALIETGPHPFTLSNCSTPWGAVSVGETASGNELSNAINNVLQECRIRAAAGRLRAIDWLERTPPSIMLRQRAL